jgi:protein-L-isoaspartate(D-aspartate) O-methyltransferase
MGQTTVSEQSRHKPPVVPGRAKSVGIKGLQGITATNSNTKISASRLRTASAPTLSERSSEANLGLNSERMRTVMIERLLAQGITNDRVLAAMQLVPRHAFVDGALASRAYDDAALPIGHSQTISQPWVVARMISIAAEVPGAQKVLEVGTGCGYQAAVMAQVFSQVYSIERIRALYDMAREHLRALKLARIRLNYGDGMAGLPGAAPFDAIVVAAAGLKIPQALMNQLAIGGVLVAPEGSGTQRLVKIQRTGLTNWERQELEEVRFVPLKAGVQA